MNPQQPSLPPLGPTGNNPLPQVNQPVSIPMPPVAPAALPHNHPAWVARAKSILLGTGADPYEQSKQLSALKAEYIKQRSGQVQ